MNLLEKHNSWLHINNFERKSLENLRAILVPHAGIKESKNKAIEAYKLIPKTFNHAIIISTNHYTSDNHILDNKYIYFEDHKFEIDSLDLKLDKSNNVFENEHSWKVQIPFLKYLNFKKLTVILVGKYDNNLLDLIYSKINEKHFIICNTDLLHCGNNYNNICPNNINEFNDNTLLNIKNYFYKNTKLIREKNNLKTMCGYEAVKLFLDLLKKLDIKKIGDYSQLSYQMKNESLNSVGYPVMYFSTNDRINLLSIPRITLQYYFDNHKNLNKNKILDDFEEKYEFEKLNEKYGIFVTIEKVGKLRGCIGTFELSNNLGRTIADKTLDSAFNDSRFEPIEKNELDELTYKVNFLSKPEIIYNDSDKTDSQIYNLIKNEIIVGVHGITIYYQNSSATYLASVLIDSFKITNFTFDDWNTISSSLRKKANGIGNIINVERYMCQEFSEDNKLLLKGGSYQQILPIFLLGLAWLSIMKIN
tara:strand:- start:1714 stop:3141 length:1428 start_codon:yes stop_codon:yes gene_type:complete